MDFSIKIKQMLRNYIDENNNKKSPLSVNYTFQPSNNINNNPLNNIFKFNHTNFLNKYKIIKKLGEGQQGEVLLVKDILTNINHVIKVFPYNEKNIKLIDKEIKILQKLSKQSGCRPEIICFKEKFNDFSKIYVVYDYYLGSSTVSLSLILNTMDESDIDLKFETLLYITYILLKTFTYIHINGIAHNDIKPDNVLINNENGEIQVIDFSLSCEEDLCIGYGTPLYTSPEIIRKYHQPVSLDICQKGDVWSLGVLLYQLYNLNSLPFETDNDNFDNISMIYFLGHKITQDKIIPSDYFNENKEDQEIFDIINKMINSMLIIDPLKRPSMSDLFIYFRKYFEIS
jgi:serine/threonine protein kinase